MAAYCCQHISREVRAPARVRTSMRTMQNRHFDQTDSSACMCGCSPTTVTSSTCNSQPVAAVVWLLLVLNSLPGTLGDVLMVAGAAAPTHWILATAAAMGLPSAPLRLRLPTQRSDCPARDSVRVAVTAGACICRAAQKAGVKRQQHNKAVVASSGSRTSESVHT